MATTSFPICLSKWFSPITSPFRTLLSSPLTPALSSSISMISVTACFPSSDKCSKLTALSFFFLSANTSTTSIPSSSTLALSSAVRFASIKSFRSISCLTIRNSFPSLVALSNPLSSRSASAAFASSLRAIISSLSSIIWVAPVCSIISASSVSSSRTSSDILVCKSRRPLISLLFLAAFPFALFLFFPGRAV